MPDKFQEIIQLLSRFQHVIWDWNGTLLNDAEIVLEANNILLREHGLKEITLADYRAKFTDPVIRYYEELGFDIRGDKFKEIGQRFIDLYSERLPRVGIFKNVPRILEHLSKAGVSQSVLSAAHQPKLRRWVEEQGLGNFFQDVFGIEDIYAASKM